MKTNCAIFIYCVTFSSFQGVDFCKRLLRFMPLTVFSLESYSIADNKNNNFYFICEKSKQRITPSIWNNLEYFVTLTSCCVERKSTRSVNNLLWYM